MMMHTHAVEETFTGIEVALHDFCQPLTVLQCKLEMGLLKGGEEATHAAVIDGLRECKRLNAVVTTMRDLMRRRAMLDETQTDQTGTELEAKR
jgi:signal transduction histidine kinase